MDLVAIMNVLPLLKYAYQSLSAMSFTLALKYFYEQIVNFSVLPFITDPKTNRYHLNA